MRTKKVLHDDVELASGVDIRKYQEWERQQNREEIARSIEKRFKERFIEPVSQSSTRNGFAMMAIGCLMIETLETFEQGKINTIRKSKQMFRDFFAREKQFLAFSSKDNWFFYDIRCGILHQAETRGGWLIHREGKQHDLQNKVIDAKTFLDDLLKALDDYCDRLRKADWNDPLWINLRRKMNSIINNSKR